MSSQVHQHIYLLLQAVLGLFLVLTGLSQSDQTTFMFCISLTIITFDIVIIVVTSVNVFSYVFSRKYDYMDLEEVERLADVEVVAEQFDRRKEMEKLQRKKNALKKWQMSLLKKELELRHREKGDPSLYGGYGYCDYGHYHKGKPVNREAK